MTKSKQRKRIDYINYQNHKNQIRLPYVEKHGLENISDIFSLVSLILDQQLLFFSFPSSASRCGSGSRRRRRPLGAIFLLLKLGSPGQMRSLKVATTALFVAWKSPSRHRVGRFVQVMAAAVRSTVSHGFWSDLVLARCELV